MLGWLLVAVALAALFFYPGLGGLAVVAGAILWYLIARSRQRESELPAPEPGDREAPGPREDGDPPAGRRS